MVKIAPDEPCPCGSGKRFGECHAPLVRPSEPAIARHVRLQVVPKPAPGTPTIFEYSGEGTRVIQATLTDVSYDCGECGSSLLAGIELDQVQNIVLKCANCGSYNLSVAASDS
jgi:DNA-directed RNA polymerase subunit RPC12/RpoP